jgi:hypothetical protein
MTLRIERVKGRIRLIGEFRGGNLDQVQTEIERCESPIVLDLEELGLIDLEGVRFLNACESAGVSILQCSAYIREWMLQERGRPKVRFRSKALRTTRTGDDCLSKARPT